MKRQKKTLKKSGASRGKRRPKTSQNGSAFGLSAADSAKVVPLFQASFCYNLYKSAMRCRALLDAGLQDLGIMTPQIGIMRFIAHLGPKSQQELGDVMGIDKTSMVKFIDILQSLKMVRRENVPTDRRVKLISLTDFGRAALDKATKVRNEVENKFLAVLTEAERESLQSILPKLLKPTE